jgi:hypothetical protein
LVPSFDIGDDFFRICSPADTGEFQSMGSHSIDAAQEYFDSVGFSISMKRWEKMGASFASEPSA